MEEDRRKTVKKLRLRGRQEREEERRKRGRKRRAEEARANGGVMCVRSSRPLSPLAFPPRAVTA
jgi:hypothetical protein